MSICLPHDSYAEEEKGGAPIRATRKRGWTFACQPGPSSAEKQKKKGGGGGSGCWYSVGLCAMTSWSRFA